MTVEEATPKVITIDIWPDNLAAYNVFVYMDTQWRTAGMGGVRTGLDYGVFPVIWDLYEIDAKDRREIFRDLQLMERAALELFDQQRAIEAARRKQK